MNKLLKVTLITAIMATSGMAGGDGYASQDNPFMRQASFCGTQDANAGVPLGNAIIASALIGGMAYVVNGGNMPTAYGQIAESIVRQPEAESKIKGTALIMEGMSDVRFAAFCALAIPLCCNLLHHTNSQYHK